MKEQTADQGGERVRSRVDLDLEVRLACPKGPIRVRSRNISLKGILCTPCPDLEEGSVCRVEVQLSEEVRVRVKGKVVRSDASDLALDFLEMDEESFHYLHNLIKYNAGNPDAIDEELRMPAYDRHLKPKGRGD